MLKIACDVPVGVLGDGRVPLVVGRFLAGLLGGTSQIDVAHAVLARAVAATISVASSGSLVKRYSHLV